MAHLAAASRATTSIMAPDLWDPWAAIATMKAVSSGAVGRTKVVAMAVGSAIRKAIPSPRAAAGIIRATAKAAGTAIRKATRKRHAAVGKAVRVGTRLATRSVLGATTRRRPAAGRNMPMTATTVATMITSA